MTHFSQIIYMDSLTSKGLSSRPPSARIQSNQVTVTERIEKLGKEWRSLPADTLLDGESLAHLIEAIKTAPDYDHVSDLFGTGTTNKEQNLYLLMTAVDSANISASNKHTLLKLLNNELATSVGKHSYFNKAEKRENQVLAQAREWKENAWEKNISVLSGLGQARELTLGNTHFSIENTTAGMTKNGIIAHDCLAYALQKNNRQLMYDYRSVTFTAENIQAQLIKIQKNYEQNQLASADGTSSFDVLKNVVSSNYAMQIDESVKTVSQLSSMLADYIQKSACMLDSTVAGGIFAATLRQPIVFVKKNVTGELVFNVLNQDGILIHQGNHLDGINIDLTDARYVHNSDGLHFERMIGVR